MISIAFIGAGNLGTHLASALYRSGYRITEVYSRTESSARTLAERVFAKAVWEPGSFTGQADVIFVVVKDDVIPEILKQVNVGNRLLVHCSGSLPLNVLNDFSDNIGVFYPLQTFTKERELDFRSIPVFLEAALPENLEFLKKLANSVASRVEVMSSDQRRQLHLAAVMANNFSNHFFALAQDYLQKRGIDFSVLHPLMVETALKASEMSPKKAQTGPAVRFDQAIIDKHLQELEDEPALRELYQQVSKSIFNFHQK